MSDESDYDGGFFRNLSGLATDWVTSKRRALEHRGTPNTFTDSGGTINKYSWDGQDISQAELAKVRDIREKGGVIAQLFHAKALIRFGTGVELQAENDDLQDLLNEKLFPDLDLLVQDLGEDAIFYPYALGEIVSKRGNGGFSHIELVEPWTMLPETDDHGDIIRWQHHVGPGEAVPFDTDDIGHIAINKSCGRDKVGISDVLRSEDEIEQYKNNQRAINNAIEVAGFPHILWKVGREGGTPIADDELRRVRSIVESIKSDSQIVMGRDIDTEQINPSEFKFGDITERDLRVLTSTIGLPFELVGYGSDGLGSGHEADLKMQLLRIQNEADRRRFADQFIREFVNPVIEQYTPYSPDEDVTLRFESFLDDKQDMATWISEVGEYMRNDDVVEHLGLPPIEDEELATAYRSPQDIEEAEEGPDEGGFGGGGGFFSDGRALQEVPDNARPISDASECDGSVVQGPRGGMYCVPSGDGDGQAPTGGGDGAEIPIEEVESGDEVQVDAVIPDSDGDPVDISGDTVDVLDVDPSYGLLIDHPDFGRGEVPVSDIGSITDPDADVGGDTATDGPSDSVDGLDLDDTVEGSDTILSDEQKEAVAERLSDAHGEAGEQAHTWANEWRQNSISGASESFASAVKDASNLGGDVRDSGRDAAEPTPEQVDAVEDMVEMSQDFFRDKFGDEAELVRGTRENSRDDFLMSVFGGEESVEINANAVDNYTSEAELAQNYAGDDGLVLRPTVSADDVQIANASLFAEGFETEGDEYLIDSPNEISADEAEVRINGESIDMASDSRDMTQDDFRTLAAEMEGAPDELRSAFDDWAGDLA